MVGFIITAAVTRAHLAATGSPGWEHLGKVLPSSLTTSLPSASAPCSVSVRSLLQLTFPTGEAGGDQATCLRALVCEERRGLRAAYLRELAQCVLQHLHSEDEGPLCQDLAISISQILPAGTQGWPERTAERQGHTALLDGGLSPSLSREHLLIPQCPPFPLAWGLLPRSLPQT